MTTKDLMPIYDQINHRFGNDTIYFASQGIERSWKRRSPSYTTRWDELLKVM